MDDTKSRLLNWKTGAIAVLAFSISALLVACGGGDSSKSEQAQGTAQERESAQANVPPSWKPRVPGNEVINGITVPPEPAPSINNATLAGVDSNKNGVRDDVERYVARKSSSSSEGKVILAGAAAYQRLLLLPHAPAPTQTQLLDIFGDVHCAAIAVSKTRGILDRAFILDRDLIPITFNTDARQVEFRTKTKDFGGYLHSELKTCK